MKKLIFILAVLFIVSLPLTAQTTWKIDPVHSKILFSVRHMMISEVPGRFKEFEGTIQQSKDDFSDSKLNATVNVKTIDTDNDKRDNHLRSADFFDAEKFPTATFVSTTFKKKDNDAYTIEGNLTLHGVTKPIVLDVTFLGQSKDPWGGTRAGFKATTTINRSDFGVKWNQALETGGVLVGDKVALTIDIEMTKQPSTSLRNQ